jgi:signal transduction histidine kinase
MQLSQDFQKVLHGYDVAVARMQASHDQLLAKVSELQAEIKRKNDMLAHRERMAVLGELAAGVAHEIRNPLGGIRLYVDLLAREQSLTEHPTVEKIQAVIGRLDRVVRDVLIHSRDIRPEPADTPLSHVIMEAVNLAARELPEGEVSLKVECGDGHARLDADLVSRLVLNLVLNAAQAIRGGDRGGTVWIRARVQNGGAYIEVRDDGPGIEPARLPELFTPFFSSRSGGTGLGLALCRRIAEAHGGEITAANHPDGGALFRVTL